MVENLFPIGLFLKYTSSSNSKNDCSCDESYLRHKAKAQRYYKLKSDTCIPQPKGIIKNHIMLLYMHFKERPKSMYT